MIWTDEMTAKLKKLWAEGLSASQCAEALGGVTRHAVLAKCDRLRKRGNLDAPARRDGDLAKARTLKERSARTSAMLAAKRKAGGPRPTWDVGRKPIVVEPYVEQGDDGVAPKSKQVTLADLENHHCRWPIGDPRQTSFKFCGCNKVPGLSYCEPHARRAYPVRYPEDHIPRGIAVKGSVVVADGDLAKIRPEIPENLKTAADGAPEREREDA